MRRPRQDVRRESKRKQADASTAYALSICRLRLAEGARDLVAERLDQIGHGRAMNGCGMYNYAGQWSYEVGMPATSGVSGCILAVIPGQLGIGVYSPPIDALGNSVRGIRVCEEISKEFELHAFNNRTNVRNVIRREYRGDAVRSNRLRPPAERRVLAEEGRKVAVAVQQLQKLAAEHPNILITILGNLTREFSERLLHANEEISALE